MNVEFTDEELFLLSEGIIALIHASYEAEKLILNDEVEKAIKSYQDKLTNLNIKVCRCRCIRADKERESE